MKKIFQKVPYEGFSGISIPQKPLIFLSSENLILGTLDSHIFQSENFLLTFLLPSSFPQGWGEEENFKHLWLGN
jgi:hypothetical protein